MCKIFVAFVIGVVLLTSCADGYKNHESGLEYKILVENKSNKQIEESDVVTLKYNVLNINDQLVEESGAFRAKIGIQTHSGGSVEDGLCLLHKGDSAVFLINGKNYFSYTRGVDMPEDVSEDEKIKFCVKILDVISEEEYNQELYALNFDRKQNEEDALAEYIRVNEIKQEPLLSGLYFIIKKETKAERPRPGQVVTVHYSGAFLNGEKFDSSFDRNEPFSFVLGSGNIIQGWEEGIANMRLGEEATLIIPSYLAYGDEQIGPIPPFSTLVFDVFLIDIE